MTPGTRIVSVTHPGLTGRVLAVREYRGHITGYLVRWNVDVTRRRPWPFTWLTAPALRRAA